jgi:hypothetical protein
MVWERYVPAGVGGSCSMLDALWCQELGFFVVLVQSGTSPTLGGVILTSPNGRDWSIRGRAGGGASSTWGKVAWAPELGLFVAVTLNGAATLSVSYSRDLVTWSNALAESGSWQAVCWSPDLRRFVIGATGTAATRLWWSDNGVNWFAADSAPLLAFNDICWARELGLFVAVGQAGAVATSPDGRAWTQQPAVTANQLLRVRWLAERRVLVASQNAAGVITSSNGRMWTAKVVPGINATASLQGLAYSPQLNRVVGLASTFNIGGPLLYG